jgi:hypothetical protein
MLKDKTFNYTNLLNYLVDFFNPQCRVYRYIFLGRWQQQSYIRSVIGAVPRVPNSTSCRIPEGG